MSNFFPDVPDDLGALLISCPAKSPCPAIRDVPTRTRIFTKACLLTCAEVLPVLSSLDSASPNIGAPMRRRTVLSQQGINALLAGISVVDEGGIKAPAQVYFPRYINIICPTRTREYPTTISMEAAAIFTPFKAKKPLRIPSGLTQLIL